MSTTTRPRSRAKRLADDEAAAVEAAENAEPQGDPGEPTEAPTPPTDELTVERAFELLSEENDRHGQAVAEIVGAETFATMGVCPHCSGGPLGFLWAPEAAPAKLKQSPAHEPCPDCDALGELLTGSRREGNERRDCVTCNGRGYIDKTGLPSPAEPLPVVATPPVASTAPNSGEPRDGWGRPSGHRDWGLDPAAVNA